MRGLADLRMGGAGEPGIPSLAHARGPVFPVCLRYCVNTAGGAPAFVATANGAAEGTPDPPAQGRGGRAWGMQAMPWQKNKREQGKPRFQQ
ncbi:MAG: hypothetical protein A3F78_15960 [Burkholderiales bacterium RIFCSPLOWO2_12_FULL_61_40]|nr:MAG: hypothetical protein A3F78_15960 [Burkholderiales bacterium RIFCSPLOWO2_12_FULL_61_40]